MSKTVTVEELEEHLRERIEDVRRARAVRQEALVNASLDSSVLLRIVLRELNPLVEWDHLTGGVTSTLTRVEAARTLDRRGCSEREAKKS